MPSSLIYMRYVAVVAAALVVVVVVVVVSGAPGRGPFKRGPVARASY